MPTVTCASPAEYQVALAILFLHLAPEQRDQQVQQVLLAAERTELSLAGLLVAREDTTVVGAFYLLRVADGTAFFWPPVVAEGQASRQILDALFTAAREWLDRVDARWAQCLLDLEDGATRSLLEQNGFPYLTDLQFLRRSFDEPLPQRPVGGLEAIAYSDERQVQFAEILARTYTGTLDCPSLNGLRTSVDALAAHRLAGQFSPSRWNVFQCGGRDVGLLLLSDHPDQNMWELVYMGIAPEMRGRGYGSLMLTEGLWRARDGGTAGVFLAVDVANIYAKKLYDKFGFQEVARRAVHMRIVAEACSR